MSEATESNLNEMKAGDGSALSMPPALVFVKPRSHRAYKKANKDYIDGRSKGAKSLLSRINRRKKNCNNFVDINKKHYLQVNKSNVHFY